MADLHSFIHACTRARYGIASHIEKLLDERHYMYIVKEETDRKQKVVRDIIIIRRHVVDQQLLDDLNKTSRLLLLCRRRCRCAFVCHRWISWTNDRRSDRSSIHTTVARDDDRRTDN